jgi:hypothetical protein
MSEQPPIENKPKAALLPVESLRPYSVDLADFGKEDPQYRFAHCYLYGPFPLNRQETYRFLYPKAGDNTVRVESSRILHHPDTREHITALCSRNKLSPEFVAHEIAREAMRLTKKKRKQIMHEGEIVTLEQEEDNDRTPALALAADVLGMRKNQETAGITVHVEMGAGLSLDERPKDITPPRPTTDDEP